MPGQVGAGDRTCTVQFHDVVDGRVETCRRQRSCRLALRRRRYIDDERVLDGAVDRSRTRRPARERARPCRPRRAAPEQGIFMPGGERPFGRGA